MTLRCALALALLTTAAACGDDSDGAGDTAAWGATCEDGCAKREMCNSNTDEPECVQNCNANTKALSAEYASVVGNCISAASCNELVNGTTDDCVDDAAAKITPSAAGKAYCAKVGAKAEECNAATDEPNVVLDCEEDIGKASASLIADLSACLDKACDQVLPCAQDVGDAVESNPVGFAD